MTNQETPQPYQSPLWDTNQHKERQILITELRDVMQECHEHKTTDDKANHELAKAILTDYNNPKNNQHFHDLTLKHGERLQQTTDEYYNNCILEQQEALLEFQRGIETTLLYLQTQKTRNQQNTKSEA